MSKYANQRRRRGKIAHQVGRVSRSFLDGDVAVMERLLPARKVQEAIAAEGLKYRDRLFPPLVTLWTFLFQVLDADGSCRAAVMRLMAWLSACGQEGRVPCGAGTGPYCKARQRLPASLVLDDSAAAGTRRGLPFSPTPVPSHRLSHRSKFGQGRSYHYIDQTCPASQVDGSGHLPATGPELGSP